MSLIPQSQRDGRWSSKPLGFSNSTIGKDGCTITALGIKFGLTPDAVNEALKAHDAFAAPQNNPFEKNLVNWVKLQDALPGVKFVYRYTSYNNDVVLANLP